MNKRIDIMVMAAIVVVLVIATISRNQTWQSDVTLWRDCVMKSPQKTRPHANLVGALVAAGQPQEAIVVGTQALKLPGKMYELHYNLGGAYHRMNQLIEAYKHARKAVDMKKDDYTMTQLGLILRDMGWRPGMPSPERLEE